MKTKILLLASLTLCIIIKSKAQLITNGSFENWTTNICYEDPLPYITTNMNIFMTTGAGNVIKSSDHHSGNYSAKLETVLMGTDSIFGGMFIGVPGQGGVSGGIPLSVHPDSLKVFAKYDVKPNDTAHIIVVFKKNSMMIGMASFAFHGIQSNFTEFKTPVNWFVPFNTDTVAVIIASSNLDHPQIPGSKLFIDDLNFINSSIPFPNGDFELWNTVSVEDPDNWQTFNYACSPGNYSATKDTNPYDGLYAMKLKNVVTLFGDTLGFITNGTFGNNGPQGGMHVNQNPSFISGYYKYIPVGLDTALASVSVFGYDNVSNSSILLASNIIKLPPVNIYTYFEVHLTYDSAVVVDTLNISFAAGNFMNANSYIGLGSALYIDKLDVEYNPVTANVINKKDNNVNIFPNPAINGIFSIDINFDKSQAVIIELYDAEGQQIYTKTINVQGKYFSTLNLSEIGKGFYYMKIKSTSKTYIKKIIIE